VTVLVILVVGLGVLALLSVVVTAIDRMQEKEWRTIAAERRGAWLRRDDDEDAH
jgi:hypothetical protein